MPDSVLTSGQMRVTALLKSLISSVTFNYVCVHPMCATVRGIVYPRTGVIGGGELPDMMLGTKLRSFGRDVSALNN